MTYMTMCRRHHNPSTGALPQKFLTLGPFKAWRASRWRRSGVRDPGAGIRSRAGVEEYTLSRLRRKTNCNCKLRLSTVLTVISVVVT